MKRIKYPYRVYANGWHFLGDFATLAEALKRVDGLNEWRIVDRETFIVLFSE